MLLSVIVCTYNRWDLLASCLKSLASQCCDPSLYEVIIIDNNSIDSPKEVAMRAIKENDNFKYIHEPRQGLSYARNRGWREASGKYIAYIDDDAIAEEKWCSNILHYFSNISPVPAAIGGPILPWYIDSPPKWFKDEFEERNFGQESGFLDVEKYPFGFSGSNMVIRKDILESYGGFSTELGMIDGNIRMGEDSELFFKLIREGEQLFYAEDVVVRHAVEKSTMT